MWNYAIRKVKDSHYVCITKDNSCDYNEDFNYVIGLFQGKHESPIEGVFRVPVDFGVEAMLKSAGFTKGEKAKEILGYYKEYGYLK